MLLAKPINPSARPIIHSLPAPLPNQSTKGCNVSTATNIKAFCIDVHILATLMAWSALSLSVLALDRIPALSSALIKLQVNLKCLHMN